MRVVGEGGLSQPLVGGPRITAVPGGKMNPIASGISVSAATNVPVPGGKLDSISSGISVGITSLSMAVGMSSRARFGNVIRCV